MHSPGVSLSAVQQNFHVLIVKQDKIVLIVSSLQATHKK